MTNSTKKDLILLGGSGSLGMEIAPGLITNAKGGFKSFRAFVRTPSKAQPLEAMGWEVTVLPDLLDIEALTTAFAGAQVIVSTYGTGEMVALEKAAIQAAKQAGVSLFVPSQFGVDYRRFGAEFPFLAGKQQVLQTAAAVGLPTLIVFTGYFTDFIFAFLTDLDKAEAKLIGDAEGGVISFTRRSDIGKVLGKALLEETYLTGGFLSMQGATMTWKEAIEKLSKATGKDFTFVSMSVEEAEALEKDLLEKGFKGDMGSFFGAFAMHLLNKPARDNAVSDISAESVTLGVDMEPFETTLLDVYGKKE